MARFGMPTLFEADSVERAAALCGELGLSFVELNANFPAFLPQRLQAQELLRLRESCGVEFTIHLDDEMNIADFNSLVAEAYSQSVRQTLELAKEAGIHVLNMHLPRGAVYTLPDRKVYFSQQYSEAYLDAVRRFRDRCHGWIAGADIKLCVENSQGFLPVQREAIDLLLESPVFGLTLDIGHDFCAGGSDGAFVLERKRHLRHMHMHDACLPNADHLPLGDGEIRLSQYLELANQVDATVVLEVKTEAGLRKSLEWLKK